MGCGSSCSQPALRSRADSAVTPAGGSQFDNELFECRAIRGLSVVQLPSHPGRV